MVNGDVKREETPMNSAQDMKNRNSLKGKIIPVDGENRKTIIDLMKQLLEKKCLDAILVPSQVPDTDFYTWLLVQEGSLLDLCDPLPPVMTVQGGKALSSLTKHGEMEANIGVLMRPCEIEAVVELHKLKQIDLDHIILFSIDCPGTVPLSDYMRDPQKMAENFKESIKKWGESESLRPICQICDRFSLFPFAPSSPKSSLSQGGADLPASDIHIGLLGGNDEKIFLWPVTQRGKDLLEKLDLSVHDSLEIWESKVEEVREEKLKKRTAFHDEWSTKIKGVDNFAAIFDECINCHNCMEACPVCYCQQCYFDSQLLTLTPEAYLERAQKRGSLRFPLDTLLFHIGRMSHMALSCVSCGACEDACPMSIPVAQVFTAVGDQVQDYFKYVPGREKEESPPLQIFLEDEFGDVETPRDGLETSHGETKENV
jgi:formate dehydrogenase subunit beta